MAGERARAIAAGVALGLAGLGSACALPTTLGELPADDSEISSVGEHGSTAGSSATTSAGPPPPPPPDTTDTGPVGPMPMHAWVMRYDQWLDALEGMATAGNTVGGGTAGAGFETDTDGGLPPETLVVRVSTGSDSCGDPQGLDECSGQWQITMLIPPSLQTPGTYDLATELSASIMMSGGTGRGDCFGGGGTLGGTVVLTVVGVEEVSGTLSPLDVGEPFDVDGRIDFVALGC